VPIGHAAAAGRPGAPVLGVPEAYAAALPTFSRRLQHRCGADFPILQERVHGKALIWLDNAATTQKPQTVIDRLSHFYAHENSNIHRAAHALAARATDAYEAARARLRRFLNAPSSENVVFVRGTTEGINLVAQTWGRQTHRRRRRDRRHHLEHHANIVPWQMLCQEKGARLRVAPRGRRGQLILDEYEKLLGPPRPSWCR
jgi:cysteine desulfurase/selenocysteine lyase